MSTNSESGQRKLLDEGTGVDSVNNLLFVNLVQNIGRFFYRGMNSLLFFVYSV